MNVYDFIKPETVESFERAFLDALGLKEFPESWSTTSVPRTLLNHFGRGLVDAWETIRQLAGSSFLSTAQGAWLRVLAREIFSVEWRPAVAARGTFRVEAASGSGGASFAAGEMLVRDSTGALFRNMEPVTVSDGGFADFSVTCATPGRVGNIPSSSSLQIVTGVPGVSVSNPGVWQTVVGLDDETDEELRQRCRERWNVVELGTAAYYEQAARKASSLVRRVMVREAHPQIGHVTIFVAGAAGSVSGTSASKVPNQTFAPGTTTVDLVAAAIKRPLCTTLHVLPAAERLVYVAGTVTVRASMLEAAKTSVAAAFADLAQALPIGGDDGVIPISEIIERVMSSGAKRFVPEEYIDVALGPHEIAVFDVKSKLKWQAI